MNHSRKGYARLSEGLQDAQVGPVQLDSVQSLKKVSPLLEQRKLSRPASENSFSDAVNKYMLCLDDQARRECGAVIDGPGPARVRLDTTHLGTN